MPVRPAPFTLICPHCRWQRSFHPASDALVIGRDTVAECPKCGSVDLERQRATAIEESSLALSTLISRATRLMGKP